MNILVTNDDGITSAELWALVRELKSAADIVVAAPDREQSASGTAITLRQPLRVQKVKPSVPGVEAYSVEGTGSDSVILALGKPIDDKVALVVSGINQGLNLGDDVLISGTVGAALQGYLRGIPAIAVSIAVKNSPHLGNATRLTALLAGKLDNKILPSDIFLNVNLPDLPLSEIKGIKITDCAHKTHIDTVKEGHDGRREYYWLVRQKLNNNTGENTDIQALEQDYISITPLHAILFGKSPAGINGKICSELFQELRYKEKGD
ncbi:MAG TPA: 5'/3'-nucleotidase SurE [Dehalococcoidia bacterium]|nr:5'/3'-nucleotidase SurE [Dehalococcoidia bacterium]